MSAYLDIMQINHSIVSDVIQKHC